MDENQTPVAKQPLLGFSALVSQSWDLYVSRFRIFAGVLIAPLVISVLATFVTLNNRSAYLAAFYTKIAPSIILFVIVITVLFLLIMFIYLWAQTAFLSALVGSNENISTRESYRRGLKIMGSYVWLVALAGAIMFGGFILLVVPGIIFAFWSMFALFVLTDEGSKGITAILKSKEYVRGYIGAIFTRMLGATILYFVVAILLEKIILAHIPYGVYLSQIISNLVLAPLLSVFFYMIYRNLKTIKGSMVFAPNEKIRKIFIAGAILGVLLVPLAILVSFMLNPKSTSDPLPYDSTENTVTEGE